MNIESTYLQYGVLNKWAAHYATLDLPASTFRVTSNKNLKEKYGLDPNQIKLVKKCLARNPIDENVLNQLLDRNRYLCCLCKGTKSDAYIIHHIIPYSQTQDNTYGNLAVLCPNDHDLVHREGQALTNKITEKQIRFSKSKWESEVEKLNVAAAMQNGEISETDYINVPRILELHQEVFGTIPTTIYSMPLQEMNALNYLGGFNPDFIKQNNKNPNTPFIFFAAHGSAYLSLHYIEIFKKLLTRIKFLDLDDLLNKRSLAKQQLIGEFCFYVGGVYGNQPEYPVTEATAKTHLYFHRRSYFVEWLIDPRYIKSVTALHRLSDRTSYIIYGRIRSIGIKEWKGKKYTYFDIRPYVFGIPTKQKYRLPAIHYRDGYDDFDVEE